MKLTTCAACHGFVPPTSEACPHCKTKTRLRLGAVATVLGSSAIAFTLMACYGAAPCAEGNSCHPNAPTPDTSATPPPTPSATPDGGK